MESTTWHYPPDFMSLMIDAIPNLVRSKRDLIAFFRGAGVSNTILSPLHAAITANADSIRKAEITARILYAVNDQQDDTGLRVRREIVKRVTEFSAFETCYDNVRLEARGAVQRVREFVFVKDTMTKLAEEARRHSEEAAATARAKRQAIAEHRARRDEILRDLSSQFSASSGSTRGKALEQILNKLFRLDNISVRESFTLRSAAGNGIIEQIDGVIEYDGFHYLVEMKWLQEPIGVPDLSQHMVRVFSRGQSRGLFIAHPGYTSTGIELVRENLRQAPFVLADLHEIVRILDASVSVADWLKPKIDAALVDRNPFVKFGP